MDEDSVFNRTESQNGTKSNTVVSEMKEKKPAKATMLQKDVSVSVFLVIHVLLVFRTRTHC